MKKFKTWEKKPFIFTHLFTIMAHFIPLYVQIAIWYHFPSAWGSSFNTLKCRCAVNEFCQFLFVSNENEWQKMRAIKVNWNILLILMYFTTSHNIEALDFLKNPVLCYLQKTDLKHNATKMFTVKANTN